MDELEIREQNINIKELPVVALRGKVLFPKTLLNFDVGRAISKNAINKSSETGGEIFVVAQKSAFTENPTKDDMCLVGVVARVKQIIKMPGNNMKVSVEALYRAKVIEYKNPRGYFSATVVRTDYIACSDSNLIEAYMRIIKNAFLEFTLGDKRLNKEMLETITELLDPNEFIDNALSVMPALKEKDVQKIMELDDTADRLESFERLIFSELEIAKIEKKITGKVRQSIDKSQKEFYLREQIKAIHSELGDDADEEDELRNKIKAKNLPEFIENKCMKEISRLSKINPSSPDYSIILNYLDWIKELPFTESTVDTENLADAKAILDADHFGLEKVKQRIVEYIAVLQLTKQIRGPILCFVGPPGVGKTSVATSIARALNRKFVRMSLGGVKDEAEIRGHRKTYVGAMPGRIITG